MNKKCFINKQYKINETKKHITRDVNGDLISIDERNE